MDSTQSLVRQETPEEREYSRYVREIEVRKQQVADKTAELESLRLALFSFEAEYHSRLGPLFIELDRLKLSIDEYEQRIVRLKFDASADPQTVEEEVARTFQATREEIRRTEEEVSGYEERFRANQQRPPLEADQEERLKQLYRILAKRFHPDLARTSEERNRRKQVMQRINAAYAARDRQSLESISLEQEFSDPEFDRRTIGEKLVWAIREVARLEALITDIESELSTVQLSQTYQLWQRWKSGEKVIETLSYRLSKDIVSTRDRLADLVAVYRQLAEDRIE